MKEETKENLKRSSTWLRFIFMVLFAIFYSIAAWLLVILIVFQFIVTLITASPNERLKPFSRQLTQYIYDIFMYLSYNSENKPFPFSDWPADPGATPTVIKKENGSN